MKYSRIEVTPANWLAISSALQGGPRSYLKFTSRERLEAYFAETLGLASAAIERMNTKLENGEVYSETAMLTDSVVVQFKADAESQILLASS